MKMLQIVLSISLIVGTMGAMEYNKIDISGLEKSAVLQALYNNAIPLGMGVVHYIPGELSDEQAKNILEKTCNFDYLHGRVLKVNICGDTLYTRLYNRDNGAGAAEKVVEKVRTAQKITHQ